MNTNNYNLLSFSKKVNNTTIEYNENIKTIKDIENNFKWLEEQFLQNNRQISILDFYNIAGSTNADRIYTDYNLLLKNSSLLLTSPVNFNGESYSVGDMVYKQSNGKPLRLELGGGIYYPEIHTNNIIWKYTKQTPVSGAIQDPYESYTIKLTSLDDAPVYGEIKIPNADHSIEFDIKKKDKTIIIPPIIKFFHTHIQSDNDKTTSNIEKWEEVFYDDFIVNKNTSNTKFIINNIPNYINIVVVK